MSYILILFWLFFAAILGHTAGMHRRVKVLGREEWRATWTYALVVMMPLILLLPKVAGGMRVEQERKLAKIVIIACFALYGLYAIYTSSWAQAYPYDWFWETL